MKFILHLLIAISILLAGSAFKTLPALVGSEGENVYFLVGACGAQFWIFGSALVLRTQGLPRFDMLVASEIIIALGVFSLIVGIVISVGVSLVNDPLPDRLDLESLRPFLTPFAEGLFAAGLAPLLATTLRQIEVLKFGAPEADRYDDSDIADAATERLHDVADAADRLVESFENSRAVFDSSLTALRETAVAFKGSADSINSSMHGIVEAFKKSSSDLSRPVNQISMAMDELEKNLRTSKSQMTELTKETRSLKNAMEEGTTLIQGLDKIIASVDRFIHPAK